MTEIREEVDGDRADFEPGGEYWTDQDEMEDGENQNQCTTCDGEGVYVESCDSEYCPATCKGHEVVCSACKGTGVRA